MLVHDGGDHCVLGSHPRMPPGMHSTLAGFVEPGESLEEAVAREVAEEVGLTVEPTSVRYFASQPWPFPSSLMVGFHARAPYRPLTVDPVELSRARWFHRKEVLESPEDESFRIPRADSIAHELIRAWLEGRA
jgi:NAD+ diphosphatase